MPFSLLSGLSSGIAESATLREAFSGVVTAGLCCAFASLVLPMVEDRLIGWRGKADRVLCPGVSLSRHRT